MDLLLIFDENQSHYMYIKDFNRFMFSKTKNKNKKHFCKCCLQCFSSEKVLIEHKENCLIINGMKNVRLGKGSISFKNYSKQLPTPFKIYADFECIFNATPSKEVKSSDKNNGSNTEKYQDHIPCSFAYELMCVLIINLVKMVFFIEERMLFTNLLKQFLKGINIVER